MSPADARIYNSERLAACYAADRPPVHAALCAQLFGSPGTRSPFGRALDVGCGAGASTRALLPHATRVIGVDPNPRMLRHARALVPAAHFIQGDAQALPIASRSCDLVTAAGSLNYTEVGIALADIARVLVDGGHFAVYDFSTGRVRPEPPQADDRFSGFERDFPWPPGYALDLALLPYAENGLTLLRHERFVVEIPLSLDDYVQYLMGETNVESAIVGGLAEPAARKICHEHFAPLFDNSPRPIAFGAEIALARRDTRS